MRIFSRELLWSIRQIDRQLAQRVRIYESNRGGHGAAISWRDTGVHRAIVRRDSDLEGADRGLDRQRLRARWPPGRLEPRLIAHDILPHRENARLRTGRLRDVESDRRRLVHQREVSSLILIPMNIFFRTF